MTRGPEEGSAEDRVRRSITVRIAGEDYLLRTQADADHTRACAELVHQQIREVREAGGVIDRQKAAVLAALSITDRYLRAQEELDRLRREVTSRSMNLVRRIEGAVGDAGEPEEPMGGGGAEGG